jgi:hypothetical protein
MNTYSAGRPNRNLDEKALFLLDEFHVALGNSCTELRCDNRIAFGRAGLSPHVWRPLKLLSTRVSNVIIFCQLLHRTALLLHIFSKEVQRAKSLRISSSSSFITIHWTRCLRWTIRHLIALTVSGRCAITQYIRNHIFIHVVAVKTNVEIEQRVAEPKPKEELFESYGLSSVK